MQKAIRKYMRKILWVIREFEFITGVWSIKDSKEVEDAITRFIEVNTSYWPEQQCARQGILIEGHLSNYGPNYLFRTAIAARAIQEKVNLGIDVVYSGYSHQWVTPRKIYSSFGINGSIHLDNHFFLTNFILLIFSKILALTYRVRLSKPEDILTIKFNTIKVGDLIYDDVLRETESKTIERIDGEVTKCIAKSIYFYFQYRLLFYKRSYSYLISTHTAYSEYGLLCRVALMYGIRVIETSDIQMSLYTQISNDELPTYHHGIKNSILKNINNQQVDLGKLCSESKAFLYQRLDSKVNQIDAQKAYCGRVYTKTELSEVLGLNKAHKIIFVLAHVFKDAPHLSSGMLHADYYQWMLSTLEICAKSSDVSWVIKPHPSSSLYGESGLVENMVNILGANNVILCPSDLNTKSLSLCADGLVTVHGTAGLEFSCLGIPVVLAGKPFYSGFGFTIDPVTKSDYEETLLAFSNIVPLSEEQVIKALEVFSIWNNQFDWHNPIVTSEIQALVWGSGVPRDLAKAYRLITDNLSVNDPRKLKLWEFASVCCDANM